MSISERSLSVQIRELFKNNKNKVSLGISTLSLTISITILAVTLFKQPPAHAYTRMKDDREESTTADRPNVVPTQMVATHKKLLQAVNKDPKFPEEHIYLTHDATNSPNEYTHGVTVTHDSLIIKFTGLYYIYCSIRFHQAKDNPETNKYVTYVNRVSPYNPGGTGVLLKSVHSAVHKTTENTFTGGVFLLHEGDIIQTCVTNEDVVDFKSESTFMGMLLLTSNMG